MLTVREKLVAVETLIEQRRQTGMMLDYECFVEIAEDLRARLVGVPGIAEVELERRVRAASKNESNSTRKIALANEVLSRWSVIKQALERFGQEES